MTRRAGLASDRGQASVEFALIVPLVIIAILLVIQVGFLVYGQLALTHAGAEIARLLAVDPSADLGQIADLMSLPGLNDLQIETQVVRSIDGQNHLLEVRSYHEPLVIFSIFEPFLEGLRHSFETKILVSK